MVDEQLVVERVRMIEVRDAAVIEWKIGDIAVVRILLNENHFAGTDGFKNAIGDSRLPRARTTRNADYHAHTRKEFHAKAQRKKKKAQRFYLAFLASFFAPL